MSEKMREFEEWWKEEVRKAIAPMKPGEIMKMVAHHAWQAALRTHENVGQESGSVQDAVDKFRALLADCTESERQQARAIFCEVLGVGGQESEAGEFVAVVMGTESNRYIGVPDLENWSRLPFGTKLYLSAPSAQAIETAAIIKCAEVLKGMAAKERAKKAFIRADHYEVCVSHVRALIPQDGRTQLEEFGMKVAEAVRYRVSDGRNIEPDDFRVIVTNLIGVPPLSSETVRGEGK